MTSRITQIIKQAEKLDKKMARELRRTAIEELYKTAETDFFLDRPNENVMEYPSRQSLEPEIRTPRQDREQLYGLTPDHKNVDLTVKPVSKSMSTRYSPDRIGVQIRRLSDGVVQDPITNRIYDWNEGFKTDDGQEFVGGDVSLQTDIFGN